MSASPSSSSSIADIQLTTSGYTLGYRSVDSCGSGCFARTEGFFLEYSVVAENRGEEEYSIGITDANSATFEENPCTMDIETVGILTASIYDKRDRLVQETTMNHCVYDQTQTGTAGSDGFSCDAGQVQGLSPGWSIDMTDADCTMLDFTDLSEGRYRVTVEWTHEDVPEIQYTNNMVEFNLVFRYDYEPNNVEQEAYQLGSLGSTDEILSSSLAEWDPCDWFTFDSDTGTLGSVVTIGTVSVRWLLGDSTLVGDSPSAAFEPGAYWVEICTESGALDYELSLLSVGACEVFDGCENGATCTNSENFFNYTCECPPGFYGFDCEFDEDVCITNPQCVYGDCTDGPGLEFTCDCDIGFGGELCEIDLDYCPERPCFNDGICVEGFGNETTCECTLDYVGELCETALPLCSTYNETGCPIGQCSICEHECIHRDLICEECPTLDEESCDAHNFCVSCDDYCISTDLGCGDYCFFDDIVVSSNPETDNLRYFEDTFVVQRGNRDCYISDESGKSAGWTVSDTQSSSSMCCEVLGTVTEDDTCTYGCGRSTSDYLSSNNIVNETCAIRCHSIETTTDECPTSLVYSTPIINRTSIQGTNFDSNEKNCIIHDGNKVASGYYAEAFNPGGVCCMRRGHFHGHMCAYGCPGEELSTSDYLAHTDMRNCLADCYGLNIDDDFFSVVFEDDGEDESAPMEPMRTSVPRQLLSRQEQVTAQKGSVKLQSVRQSLSNVKRVF